MENHKLSSNYIKIPTSAIAP